MSGPAQTPEQPAHSWDPAVCQSLREDVAIALLTRQALPAQAQSHAQICPPCGDEFAELMALPGLLSAVGDDSLAPPEQPSEQMLARLLEQVASRRRRVRWTTIAAAAAVVAIAIPVGFSLGRSDSAQTTGAPVTGSARPSVSAAGPGVSSSPSDPDDVVTDSYSSGTGTDAQTGTRVEVAVMPADWGSRIEVEVYGVPGGTQCRMVVIDRNNLRVESGSWTVPPSGYTRGQTFPETVMTRPQDVRAIELIDNRTERVMVRVPVVRT